MITYLILQATANEYIRWAHSSVTLIYFEGHKHFKVAQLKNKTMAILQNIFLWNIYIKKKRMAK